MNRGAGQAKLFQAKYADNDQMAHGLEQERLYGH